MPQATEYLSYEDTSQKLEAHSIDFGRPVTAICVDTQERYVVAIEGGEVFRLKRSGKS